MIQPGLFALYERFPQQINAIRGLYLRSESFQTLCADYEQCAAAMDYWEGSPNGEAGQLSEEYRNLLAELEEEVRQMLGQAG